VRRGRRTLPTHTRWITYVPPRRQAPRPSPSSENPTGITALRYAVATRAPWRAETAVLLADAAHYRVAERLAVRDERGVLGSGGATTDHRHAHWLPVPNRTGGVEYVLVWVPMGLSERELADFIDLRALTGRQYRGGENIRGFPDTRLLLQATGPVAAIAPEVCGPARRWRSLTPYLPVRHRRREDLDEYVAADVSRELGYRSLSAATVRRLHPDEGYSDRWSIQFRRYRLRERLAQARRGVGLSLEFAEPVAGPIALGQLSHFGYGLFAPEAA
jgi:CRISPR-associated protein Csb2